VLPHCSNSDRVAADPQFGQQIDWVVGRLATDFAAVVTIACRLSRTIVAIAFLREVNRI
jgi:hypothetical protein